MQVRRQSLEPIATRADLALVALEGRCVGLSQAGAVYQSQPFIPCSFFTPWFTGRGSRSLEGLVLVCPTNSEAHSFFASAVKGSGKAVEFALAVLMAFLEP